MNYCTEALGQIIEMIQIMKRRKLHSDETGLCLIADLLYNCQKFVIPPPERVHAKVKADACKWLRTPYPAMAIEYSITHPMDTGGYPELECRASSKRIALVVSVNGPHKVSELLRAFLAKYRVKVVGNEFAVISIFYVDSYDMWIVAPSMAVLEPNKLAEDPNTLIDWHNSKFQLAMAPILPDTYNEILEGNIKELGNEEAGRQRSEDMSFNDIAEEAAMAVRTMLLLNTKNVNTVKVNNPSNKLNHKRAKNGKPPFFAYHTVNIFLGKPLKAARRMSEDEIHAQFMREVPQHMVIGHYKVRKTGVFWWEHFVRGHAKDGFIDKEYKVKE